MAVSRVGPCNTEDEEHRPPYRVRWACGRRLPFHNSNGGRISTSNAKETEEELIDNVLVWAIVSQSVIQPKSEAFLVTNYVQGLCLFCSQYLLPLPN